MGEPYDEAFFWATHQGAAIVPLDDLKLLEAIEDRLDADDALVAREEADREGTTTPWETIKAELGL